MVQLQWFAKVTRICVRISAVLSVFYVSGCSRDSSQSAEPVCFYASSSCSWNPPVVTELGYINFVPVRAEVALKDRITRPGGQSFFVDSVTFDSSNDVAYLVGWPSVRDEGYEFKGEGSNPQICTLSQPLTYQKANRVHEVLRSVSLCKSTYPYGTAYPATIETLAAVLPYYEGKLSGFGNQQVVYPGPYIDDVPYVCRFSDFANIAHTVLSQIDLAQPMSCLPYTCDPNICVAQ